MSVAPGASDFGPLRKKAFVFAGRYVLWGDWLPEARPPRAGFVFMLREIQVVSAADALVDAMIMIIPRYPGEGTLRTLFAGDIVLFWRQQCAPFSFSFDDLIAHKISFLGCGI